MVATSAFTVVEQFARELLGDLLVGVAKQAVWTPIFLPESLHGEWQVCVVAAGVVSTVISARRLRRTEVVVVSRRLRIRLGRLQFDHHIFRIARRRD